ncbi:MAG TPA: hypothetical protein GX706_00485 [Candidatus Moranbacteria bacterium]|nr:hypothetical protein [Candidatus Moranbacteria bacterium]
MDYLENLLRQPENVRRRVAYLATAVISVLLVSVWLLITSYNMGQALNPGFKTNQTAENFRQSLPELRQTDSVTTELGKQRAAKVGGIE